MCRMGVSGGKGDIGIRDIYHMGFGENGWGRWKGFGAEGGL